MIQMIQIIQLNTDNTDNTDKMDNTDDTDNIRGVIEDIIHYFTLTSSKFTDFFRNSLLTSEINPPVEYLIIPYIG